MFSVYFNSLQTIFKPVANSEFCEYILYKNAQNKYILCYHKKTQELWTEQYTPQTYQDYSFIYFGAVFDRVMLLTAEWQDNCQ